ncbi:MAG: aminoglycoside phosphotransferase family protein, partial [Acidimicrobiia bacterium]|nr:aminoglycoside phosphotransferase family protein [Acidimicrobiia bacterium]
MPPSESHRLDPETLNALLSAGSLRDSGMVTDFEMERIGADYGFSGTVYRLHCRRSDGRPFTLVAKFESPAKVRRSVAFHTANEGLLDGNVPGLFGWSAGNGDAEGVLILEDVHDAVQGDDLAGCSRDQAGAVIDIVARLHAGTRGAPTARVELTGWAAPALDVDRWRDRLGRAAARYPGSYTTAVVARLEELPAEAADGLRRLADGPATWLHLDPHLDNVLFRRSGDAVLLDWSGASIAYPALDVAQLLVGYALRPRAALTPDDLLDRYATAVQGNNGDTERVFVEAGSALAMRRLIQGMVG